MNISIEKINNIVVGLWIVISLLLIYANVKYAKQPITTGDETTNKKTLNGLPCPNLLLMLTIRLFKDITNTGRAANMSEKTYSSISFLVPNTLWNVCCLHTGCTLSYSPPLTKSIEWGLVRV